MLAVSQLSWSTKAAQLESLYGSREKTVQFIQAVHIAVMMQIDTFTDERMKSLYMLLFMHEGMAQVWAANETNAILSSTSLIRTLETPLANIKNAFGNPDQERTACMHMNALKMLVGMTAEEYMAKFEMLAGRTGFSDAALEDAYT